MSNQTSNQQAVPRRRRIAGERRPRTVESASAAAPPKDEAATGTLTVPRPSAPTQAPARRSMPPQRRRRAEGRAPAPSRRTTGTGWWGSTTSLAVLAAALVVLLAVSGAAALGWLSWAGVDGVDDVRSGERVEAASDSAAAAAERAAAAILVYDHRRLEQDRDAAAEFMTEEMASKYTETFDSVVAPAAKQTQAQVTVEVQGSAVVRGAEDRVRVLLFVDQSTTSTANANPKLALNRVEMVMVRQDGSWLVDEITSY
ncbi:hypothetical protein [Nocardioides caldifontis]|uniref:hypothetical protein n=1 Tax=Nocardioides caldifontis TaxID=2588938 RepID=UPI0011E00E18|nr:hypothetical protein [Nocardioides caldifontis]